MNILLFGGNSQRNKPWIHEVAETLAPEFDTYKVHDYAHWGNRGAFIDFNTELAKIPDEVKDLGNYVVFAKSIGSILTLMGISQGLLKPVKCIFVGLPIKLAEEGGIALADLLQAQGDQVPALCMQNTNDPLASYARLTDLLQEANASNYTSIELSGDTHGYDDLAKMRNIVRTFVADAPRR